MVTHINLLSICLMFYIVGNIDAIWTNRTTLNYSILCWRQMIQHSLIIIDDEENVNISFDAMMNNFYRRYSTHHDMTRVMDDFYERLETDMKQILVSLYILFFDNDDVSAIALPMRLSLIQGVPYDEPLANFIRNFSTRSDKVFIKYPNNYCLHIGLTQRSS